MEQDPTVSSTPDRQRIIRRKEKRERTKGRAALRFEVFWKPESAMKTCIHIENFIHLRSARQSDMRDQGECRLMWPVLFALHLIPSEPPNICQRHICTIFKFFWGKSCGMQDLGKHGQSRPFTSILSSACVAQKVQFESPNCRRLASRGLPSNLSGFQLVTDLGFYLLPHVTTVSHIKYWSSFFTCSFKIMNSQCCFPLSSPSCTVWNPCLHP